MSAGSCWAQTRVVTAPGPDVGVRICPSITEAAPGFRPDQRTRRRPGHRLRSDRCPTCGQLQTDPAPIGPQAARGRRPYALLTLIAAWPHGASDGSPWPFVDEWPWLKRLHPAPSPGFLGAGHPSISGRVRSPAAAWPSRSGLGCSASWPLRTAGPWWGPPGRCGSAAHRAGTPTSGHAWSSCWRSSTHPRSTA